MIRVSLFIILLVQPLYRLLRSCHGSLLQLRATDDSAQLPFSPNELNFVDVILIICVFIGRSIKNTIGFRQNSFVNVLNSSKTLPVASKISSNDKQDNETLRLPSKHLYMPLQVQQDDIKSYVRAISAGVESTSDAEKYKPQSQLHLDILTSTPAHLSLFLSAISEPALLLLLARKGCPITPLGAVNVRNRFELIRPELCTKMIEDTINANSTVTHEQSSDQYTILASLPESARRAKRGIEFDIIVSIFAKQFPLPAASADGEESKSVRIFEQIFTILQFVHSSRTIESTPDPYPSSTKGEATSQTGTQIRNSSTQAIRLALPGPLPTQWASLCKDYNPIHLSTVMAKLYGFKGKLAHGNHVVARAVEALRTEQWSDGKALEVSRWKNMGERIWMEVKFKRPIVVPGDVEVRFIPSKDQNEIVDIKGLKLNSSSGLDIFVLGKQDKKLCIEMYMGPL